MALSNHKLYHPVGILHQLLVPSHVYLLLYSSWNQISVINCSWLLHNSTSFSPLSFLFTLQYFAIFFLQLLLQLMHSNLQ